MGTELVLTTPRPDCQLRFARQLTFATSEARQAAKLEVQGSSQLASAAANAMMIWYLCDLYSRFQQEVDLDLLTRHI